MKAFCKHVNVGVVAEPVCFNSDVYFSLANCHLSFINNE